MKAQFLHLEEEFSQTNSQLYELRNEMCRKNNQIHKIRTMNAAKTLRLSLAFFRMRTAKQKVQEELTKFEQMCADQIIHMKEQSDLMRYVTENVASNDPEIKKCPNVSKINY